MHDLFPENVQHPILAGFGLFWRVFWRDFGLACFGVFWRGLAIWRGLACVARFGAVWRGLLAHVP
ncbi:MAG TPA: hypothetical protein VK797_05025 [Tepidisphaeraceae bacterium]|nr:hypothetical protein [Tepidisphaeraceae bacterium]